MLGYRNSYAIVLLTTVFAIGVVGLVWYAVNFQQKIVSTAALTSAEFYSKALREFRAVYSSEVAARVGSHPDFTVSHDYASRKYAIPVPAALGMEAGKRIGDHIPGTEVHLYSAYPFPWRSQTEGLNEAFRSRAWQALNNDPARPYYEFTLYEGQPALRYASAYLMGENCVACHNSHAEAPKSDWKVGQVSGVLEIVQPMAGVIEQTWTGARGMFIWTGLGTLFGLACLALLFTKFRTVTDELERRVEERTDEVRKAERKLRSSLEYNNSLLETVRSAIIGVDNNDRVTFWNAAAERYFGVSRHEAIDKPILELGLGWDWVTISKRILNCKSHQAYSQRFDIEYHSETSGSRILSVGIAPFMGEVGVSSGYLVIADDVTEQKIQQSHYQQTEKLQSIGQLAAGIAHEINTPMQYVGDNARFLQESFQELNELVEGTRMLAEKLRAERDVDRFLGDFATLYDECDVEYLVDDVPKAIEQSLEGIDRVTTIVKAMKDFSHPGSENREPVNINKAIESTVTVTRNVWKYVANLETDFDPKMGELPCFAGPFNEVVLNVIVNAAHAIGSVVGDGEEEKGLIHVSTKRYEDYGEIRIKDTGTGIPVHIQKKIFDPFFTTKEVGKGTGQGLALCHQIIVEQHGGKLLFESEEGKGTTFIIQLPTEIEMEGG